MENEKRTDYISWDEYFMGVAILSGMSAQRPKFTGRSLYCKPGQ